MTRIACAIWINDKWNINYVSSLWLANNIHEIEESTKTAIIININLIERQSLKKRIIIANQIRKIYKILLVWIWKEYNLHTLLKWLKSVTMMSIITELQPMLISNQYVN